MNFIKILFSLKLDRTTFSSLNDKDVIKIGKRINVEVKLNKNFSNLDAEKAINAIKNHPNDLENIFQNKLLIETVINEKISESTNNETNIPLNISNAFFDEYLGDDIISLFKKKFTSKKYKFCLYLMSFSSTYSDSFLDVIENQLTYRLQTAAVYLRKAKSELSSEYNYVTKKNFHLLLSYFSSYEMDTVFSSFYNILPDAVNSYKKPRKFYVLALLASSFYTATGDELKTLLQDNKKIARGLASNLGISKNKKKSKGKRTFVNAFHILIILVIAGSLFIQREHNHEQHLKDVQRVVGVEKDILSSYSLPKEQAIDYLFYSYLTTKPNLVDTYLKIETGDAPFSRNKPSLDKYGSNKHVQEELEFNNKTSYDIIVLCYSPNNTFNSFYVKSGDKFLFDKNESYVTKYVFYFGKRPATVALDANNRQDFYKKNTQTPETRFMDVPGFSKKMIYNMFSFQNNVVIEESDKYIIIESNTMFNENDKSPRLVRDGLYKIQK